MFRTDHSESQIAKMSDDSMLEWISDLGGVPAGGSVARDGLLMSLYSTLAYRVLSEYELKNARRIKVIPSHSIQGRAKRGRELDLLARFGRSRLFELGGEQRAEAEVIFTRLLAILILRVQRVDIVAIRGTLGLQDLRIDLRTKLFDVEAGPNAIRFHEGFYLAAAEASAELNSVLHRRRAQQVYLTGHSLGGAVAAIYRAHPRLLPDVRVHECHTFGMPRYGNACAMSTRPIPRHICFEKPVDWIPAFPGAKSYADALPSHQILVRGNRRGRRCTHAGGPVGRKLVGVAARLARTPGHFVEHYASALECLAHHCPQDDDLVEVLRTS